MTTKPYAEYFGLKQISPSHEELWDRVKCVFGIIPPIPSYWVANPDPDGWRVTDGFMKFLEERIGDLIPVETDGKEVKGTGIHKSHLKDEVQTILYVMETHKVDRLIYSDRSYQGDQYRAVEKEKCNIVRLMGGESFYGEETWIGEGSYPAQLEKSLLSWVRSGINDEDKDRVIKQMEMIDNNLPEIRASIEKLIGLSTGKILSDEVLGLIKHKGLLEVDPKEAELTGYKYRRNVTNDSSWEAKVKSAQESAAKNTKHQDAHAAREAAAKDGAEAARG